MESLRQASETVAEGWMPSFRGAEIPRADDQPKGRKKRPRWFQTSKLAKARAKPKPAPEQVKKAAARKKKVKRNKHQLKEKSKKIDAVARNFTRSKTGAKLVKQQMQEVLDLDKGKYPAKPIFDAKDGTCRMRIGPAALGQTWEKILAKAPGYFYRVYGTRSREGYGTSVANHFAQLKTKLQEDDRMPWLRLLRGMCEMSDSS